MIVPAYAKINLTLDVGQRRPDGYHDIRSVMQTVALHDTLEIVPTPDRPGVHLSVVGDEATGVPADASNIVHKAAVRLQKIAAARGTHPGHASGLQITLTKRIPSQAGLGGGSSDAAATLKAVNEIFGLDLSPRRLTEIAAALGADVPFFLTGGTALVEGLGERVTPLPPFSEDCSVVIVKPPVGVSTAAAYAALDAIPDRVPGQATEAWLHHRDRLPLGNDFERVILPAYPVIATAWATLRQTSELGECFGPLLCGSGSALFCAVRDEETARVIADQVRAAEVGGVWVTRLQGANA